MLALARWCLAHRRAVLGLWIAAVVAFQALGAVVGSDYGASDRIPGTDSQRAVDLLRREFPQQAGAAAAIVVKAKTGDVRAPATRAAVEGILAKVRAQPHVRAVGSPYAARGQISRDGRVAFANVTFDRNVSNVPKPGVLGVVDVARAADGRLLQVELNGAPVGFAVQKYGISITEVVGVLAAAAVLLLAFGSWRAMLLPLLCTAFALGAALPAVALLSHLMSVADFSGQLATLIGLGVGIDYALFIVSRHRTELARGASPHDAAVAALGSSGRAVVVAGATVCIALLGLFVLGQSALYGPALAAALTVASTMLAAVTLLPALLGFWGAKVRGRRATEGVSARWLAWARLVQRRPIAFAAAGTLVMVVLALPFLSLRLGAADDGTRSESLTVRRAYDLLAQGFGPGFNAPFLVAAEPADRGAIDKLAVDLRAVDGVAAVSPPAYAPSGRAAVLRVYPSTSPQAAATADTLEQVRDRARGAAGLEVHVGGQAAATADFARVMEDKLPLFALVVIGLSFGLLMVAFRSLLVPALGAAMNLLAAAAAFGVTIAVFQLGWGASAIGLDTKAPIDPFIPIFVMAILFGLSMDYQVFLVSRIRERWLASGDNGEAVALGQADSARVISAAAAIMVLVFASFVFAPEREIKLFGLSLGAAVVLDALIVRTMLVPAFMHLAGKANWWLPRRLDRALPRVALDEGH